MKKEAKRGEESLMLFVDNLKGSLSAQRVNTVQSLTTMQETLKLSSCEELRVGELCMTYLLADENN